MALCSRNALNDDHWGKNPFWEGIKPYKTETWFQVWKRETRSWNKFKKIGKRYVMEKGSNNKSYISTATPWINTSNVILDEQLNSEVKFKALQKWISQTPTDILPKVFLKSVGYRIGEYEQNYLSVEKDKGIGEARVKPFNLRTFYYHKVGEGKVEELLGKMLNDFFGEEVKQLKEQISQGELSEEQFEQLKETMVEKFEDALGAWGYLFVDIPLISDAENFVADILMSENLEELRSAAAEMPVNDDYFENICEAP